MKKLHWIIILFVLFIIGTFIAYFTPWKTIISNVPYLGDVYNNTSLTINSRRGKFTVTINNKSYGETPLNLTSLPEGKYEIKIEKITDAKEFYQPHTFYIELTNNTEAVLDLEIGPQNIMAGYVLYYTNSPQILESSGYISITSEPSVVSVYLENEILGNTPIQAKKLKENTYQLKITAEGYESLEFPVIIRKSYNLNVKAILLPIPTNLTAPTETQ